MKHPKPSERADDIAARVKEIIGRLQTLPESVDRNGRPTWRWLNSEERCWRCGRQVHTEVQPEAMIRHHIVPESEGGKSTPDNLSLLCADCHAFVHTVFYGTVGRGRTRHNGGRRLTGKKAKVQLTLLMDDPSKGLQDCRKCSGVGTVSGVFENYFDNDVGILVTLNCPVCGHKFAVPFLGRNAFRPA